ncbi:MAG: amidase [Deltaproteobacteria bacterium]|nr:amidase [Deltaproteobacteria bacterium]
MAANELCFLSISELAEQIKKRDVSPVEVTQAYLDRIQAIDLKLNSFITMTAERALQEAKAAEAQIRGNTYLGPLHGVPLAHKDIIATKGIKTTCGSKVLKDAVPDYDATVIERLRAAGSVLLGKLNMNEFATISPSVYFGRVNNPWNLEHNPGGSSSGSGVAVATGLCAGSLGTDTGGSIRIPAAFCDIVGLKATHGRISLFGVTPLAWSLDHVGPMTRTVKDAALMLQALAGHDARDLGSSEAPVSDYTAKLTGEVKGLRLGVPARFFPDYTDPEVRTAFEKAVTVFAGLGAHVEEVTLPALDDAWSSIAQPILNGEANVWHEPYLQTQAEDYGPQVRKFLERGKPTLATDYVKAQRAKARLRQEMLAACAHIDALLTPGELIPPQLHEARSAMIAGREVSLMAALISATCPFNLTGQPALTVPCGFTTSGLPLALQVVGNPFDEATVLQVGHAYEAHTSWHERRPPVD